MPKNNNALAELAEFLKEESKVSKSEEFKARAIASFGEDSWKRYLAKKNKILTASRIISELAKVADDTDNPWDDSRINAVVKCRAIADELAENEDKL